MQIAAWIIWKQVVLEGSEVFVFKLEQDDLGTGASDEELA